MLSTQDTRASIDRFLERKFKSHGMSEDDIQFYARDLSGNVYRVDSIDKADSIKFRYAG